VLLYFVAFELQQLLDSLSYVGLPLYQRLALSTPTSMPSYSFSKIHLELYELFYDRQTDRQTNIRTRNIIPLRKSSGQ